MKLALVSAWNDSGGGFTHRLLDGHSQINCWPFELLLGSEINDFDRFGPDWFLSRYRWPRLGVQLRARDFAAAFDSISDFELKSMLLKRPGAKHANFLIPVDLEEWRSVVVERCLAAKNVDQALFVQNYIEAFFSLSGHSPAALVLGHCPIIILDAPEVWSDFPDAKFIHVIRNPLSGYAAMRERHPGLDPGSYARKWSLVNGAAAVSFGKRPSQVCLVGLHELVENRSEAVLRMCQYLEVDFENSTKAPTWWGRPIDESNMGPFGGVADLGNTHQVSAGIESGEIEKLRQMTASTIDLLGEVGFSIDPLKP